MCVLFQGELYSLEWCPRNLGMALKCSMGIIITDFLYLPLVGSKSQDPWKFWGMRCQNRKFGAHGTSEATLNKYMAVDISEWIMIVETGNPEQT